MPKIQKQILYFIFAICLITILWYLSEGLKANPSIESRVTPTSYFMVERDDYILSYDARNRNPLWVLEHLIAEKLEGSIKRDQFKFKEDERIPQIFRATMVHPTNAYLSTVKIKIGRKNRRQKMYF